MPGPKVAYDKDFLKGETKRLFDAFEKLTWNQHTINMYGKKILAPRQCAWMGEPPKRMYGEPIVITPWTPEAIEILQKVKASTGCEFDSLNINMYRNQDDYLGWHIDPEDEGLWKFPIASVTLGAERPFQMRPYTRVDGKRKGDSSEAHELTLISGSLLVMPPGFQAEWEHQLGKHKAKSGKRINLTFRKVKE